jgi:hypothetical protein
MSDRTEALLAELVELQRRQLANQERAIAQQTASVAQQDASVALQREAVERQRKAMRIVWALVAIAAAVALVPMLYYAVLRASR